MIDVTLYIVFTTYVVSFLGHFGYQLGHFSKVPQLVPKMTQKAYYTT